jgi:ribose 5-phosphate isomerase B
MRLVIGSDHAAAGLKDELAAYVKTKGYDVTDISGDDASAYDDYPLVAEKAARAVADGQFDSGLLFCGTGLGMMLAANKVRGIRCAVCSDPYSAVMARSHNDANMLALGARVLGTELAKMLVDLFLSTPFDGGRHATRVNMITAIESRF